MPEESLITVEASSEELSAIDAAIRGYVQLLRFAVEPSPERDEVIAQLRSFQSKYEKPFMDWRQRQHSLKQTPPNTQEAEKLISWQVTAFELMAFGTAVVGYLHVPETTQLSLEVRSKVINHLLSFERRYVSSQKIFAFSN